MKSTYNLPRTGGQPKPLLPLFGDYSVKWDLRRGGPWLPADRRPLRTAILRAGQEVGYLNTGGPDWRVTRGTLREGAEGELLGDRLYVRQPVRGWRRAARSVVINYGDRVMCLTSSRHLREGDKLVAKYKEDEVTVVEAGDLLLILLVGCANLQAHVHHPLYQLL